jgi:anti-sigma B factor antagonist
MFLRFVSFPDVNFQCGVVCNVADNVMNLDIVDMKDGITNVVLSGRMDVQGALSVDKKFSAIADEKKKVVIDLSEVTFMASLGIRTLIMSCKTLASKGGDMVLLNPQPNVEKVLRTSGVDTVIQIVHDMNAAAAIFSK